MLEANARVYDVSECSFYRYRKPIERLNFLVCVIDFELPESIEIVRPQPDEEIKGLIIGGANLIDGESESVFDIFTKVTYYGLLQHNIEKISSENFTDCLWLEGLDISNGKLMKIEPEAFQDLIRLRDVDLSKNELDYIHPQTFQALVSLEKLKLNNNKLFAIEAETFASNRKLNLIDLRNNNIAYVFARVFDHLYGIRELYLTGNTCINTDFKPPRIQSLRFSFLQPCKETQAIMEVLAERRDEADYE
jgi:Leucine-rich repeat (LRR) protein